MAPMQVGTCAIRVGKDGTGYGRFVGSTNLGDLIRTSIDKLSVRYPVLLTPLITDFNRIMDWLALGAPWIV